MTLTGQPIADTQLVLLPRNGGFDFPQWHLITAAALQPHSPGVSHGYGQRQRAAPSRFFVLLLVSFVQLTDTVKAQRQQSRTRLIFQFGNENSHGIHRNVGLDKEMPPFSHKTCEASLEHAVY